MRNVEIKNKDILDTLDKYLDFYYNRDKYISAGLKLQGHAFTDREIWINDEHRDNIINLGHGHSGFPEASICYNLAVRAKGKDTVLPPTEGIKKYTKLNAELQEKLCAKYNALCLMYPPGGFISWHNNANAYGYNIVFTWSETGDGYFKYRDPHTEEDVIIQDVKGWQCKAGYFGGYSEPKENLVYHTASTDCWRITISYLFTRDEMSLGIQEDVIDEINSI
tara:strand:+ start:354 stop:1019 length:666 start_codon:yes stop_codon:yes gene_type:complete